MLPDHHLLNLVPNRINAALIRLRQAIWTNVLPLAVEATPSGPEQFSWADAQRIPRHPVVNETSWGKLFDQRWCWIKLPASFPLPRFLNWEEQGEATLYLEGKPYFGFDVAHSFCRLPDHVEEVWIECNCIQSAIWHPQARGLGKEGSHFSGAFLCNRNEEVWRAYHDLRCLFEVALDLRTRDNPTLTTELNAFGQQPHLERVSPVYRQLLRRLDQAVDALDLKGIDAMKERLAEAYSYFRQEKTFMSCVLTGHAHIDLVWLWPERIGELKAVHSFATMNRLMENYPEFRFAYSQPASYEAVKRRSPELYAEVMGRVRSGHWQATGAMYVESDTLLACGEALARSFMLGQKGFQEINGHPAKLNWLPDVFGYSACLPQLMKLTGVDYFFTTKMTWNGINRFPYSSFIWKGNDGSEVLAHVTQDSGYVTFMRVSDVKAPMLAHQQGDIHSEYLLPTGYGDGGGGATDEMCESARRLGSLPGMPSLTWGHPEAFFDRLNKIRDKLPCHQGECYLEFHRGTFTTHGKLKSTFRSLEKAMQLAEAVASATGARWDMEHHWKRLIFSQFHDYIPGSSVMDVYEEGLPELERLTHSQRQQTISVLEKKVGPWCIFNPHALPVQCRVSHPVTNEELIVRMPPLSGSNLDLITLKELPIPVTVDGRKISNGLVEFQINSKGYIDELKWEGQSTPIHDPLAQFVLYPDKAANFEAWDIDRQTLSLGEKIENEVSFQDWNSGGHRQGIQVLRKLGINSQARVTYSLEPDSHLLWITIDLDWNEPEHLLKLHFPTAYSATNARFGAPFSSVLRPQVTMDLASEAKWEVPFSRYLAVFDEGEMEGLFIATESKYGASVRNGNIGLSLVRSPRIPGFEAHAAAWPKHLSRLKIESPCSDIGSHVIRLVVGRYANDLPRERQPAVVAETAFTEPILYQGEPLPPILERIDGGQTLVPAWVMPLEEKSWLVRFHEVGGRRGSVELHVAGGWKWEECDILGIIKTTTIQKERVEYLPYQIISVRFSPAVFRNQ